MNKKFKIAGLSTAALFAGAVTASAATLSLMGGAGQTVPGNFGPLGDVNGSVSTPANLTAPVTVYDGSDNLVPATAGLFVSGGANVNVTLTYLGFEAGNTNTGSSILAGGSLFSSTTSAQGDTISFSQTAGSGTLLAVFFSTVGEGTAPCSINNGVTFGSPCQLAFSSIFSNGQSTYAMFGDGLGDSDLDDMVFRVDVSPVPLPAAGFLLFGALGGLAAMRRRKKAA